MGVAVQATGHGPSRAADGQMLVNTSRLDSIEIDPRAHVARVGAGVRGGALVAAAAEHGLAPVNGSSPDVGVVSYHLGGGLGILGRALGWAVDHVRSLEIVTADGSLRRVSPSQEPELFWALRGGGKGTLGVVVTLEIDLHPISRIHGGGMHFIGDSAARALRSWAEWTRTAPEEMSSSALIVTMPNLSVIPEPLRGRRVVHLRFACTGTATEAERLVQPFRELAPVTDTVAEMAYADVGSIHAEPTTPVAFHARNIMLDSLPRRPSTRSCSGPAQRPVPRTSWSCGTPGVPSPDPVATPAPWRDGTGPMCSTSEERRTRPRRRGCAPRWASWWSRWRRGARAGSA